MKIVLLNTQVPFCRGGAEILADDLESNLKAAGHDVDQIRIPFKWNPQESLINNILACKLFDIESASGVNVDLAIGLKFPAWLVPHKNKAFWIVHQHRSVYDLWETPYSDVKLMPDGDMVRELIIEADKHEISTSKRVFTISETVSRRLRSYNHLESKALYPPPRNAEAFFVGAYKDYFFFPSRVSALKRQAVVIEALAECKQDVRVVFCGEPDNQEYYIELQKRARKIGVTEQITWLGMVSEQEKLDLYSNALMVIFIPYDEDYGYVTPEAMLSSKGVITFEDSGGALEFVRNNVTGLVVANNPSELANKMDQIWSERHHARRMGENARQFVHELNLSWDTVLQGLLDK